MTSCVVYNYPHMWIWDEDILVFVSPEVASPNPIFS